MGQRVFLKEYDFNLTAGGIAIVLAEAEYFRIQASNGPVSIMIDGLGELPNLQAGQGIKSTPFKRLTIRDVSGAANVGRILVSNQEFIDNRTYGVNSLDAATMANLKLPTPRPEGHTGFFNDATATTANTPVALFSPASNVNGVVLLDAMLNWFDTLTHHQAFIAKASAPALATDGAAMLDCGLTASIASNVVGFARLSKEQFIPAGLGLYFIDNAASVVGSFNWRSARWKTL